MANNEQVIAEIAKVGEAVRRIDSAIVEIKQQLSNSSTDITKLKQEVDSVKTELANSKKTLDALSIDIAELKSDRDKVLGGFFTLAVVGGVVGTIAGFFKPFVQYVAYLVTKQPAS